MNETGWRFAAAYAPLTALIVVLCACSPSTGPPDSAVNCDAGATDVSFSQVYSLISTNNRCGAPGQCHNGAASPPAGLDMSTQTLAYTNLLNMCAATAGICSPMDVVVRVLPGDPQHSMLWRRVSGTTCGEQMPYHLTPLSCTEQNLINAWIAGGASQ